MMWVDRIVEATGWRHPEAGPESADWTAVEAQLEVSLPGDFKELSRRFVPGAFSAYLGLLRPTTEHEARALLRVWESYHQFASSGAIGARNFEPYGVYDPDRGTGLLPWGEDETEGQYFWLADRSADPDGWPVIARKDVAAPWRRFDMPAAEVVHRVIADPEFTLMTIAYPAQRAFYLPHWQPFPTTPEEWSALLDPDGAD
jgi:hypothetical protein